MSAEKLHTNSNYFYGIHTVDLDLRKMVYYKVEMVLHTP